MKLRSKFIWSSMIIVLSGSIISALFLVRIVKRQATEDVTYRAELMMAMADAVRQYTSEHVRQELLEDLYVEEAFIEETVPAFAARTVFNNLQARSEYRPYIYKEATENPTNPINKAIPFEMELIEAMRNDSTLEEMSGRTAGDFYVARPIRITNEACLSCHNAPEDAPASLIRTYGDEGGFGWEMNEIVGIQIIYVPTTAIMREAFGLFAIPAIALFASTALLAAALNYLVRRFVVEPVKLLEYFTQSFQDGTWEGMRGGMRKGTKALHLLSQEKSELGVLANTFIKMAEQVDERTTALESANELLRESEEAKKVVIENIPDQLMLLDRGGRFLMYQAGKESRLPFKSEEVTGKHFLDLFPKLNEHHDQMIEALNSGEERTFEYALQLSDSEQESEFESRIIPLSHDEALVLVRDVSLGKKRENSQLQTQKLESIGLLAGGIAHDFNNLLAGMMGQISLAKHKMEDDARALKHVEKASLAAERAATLTQQLLAYSGKGSVVTKPLNLTQFVQENSELLESSVREGKIQFYTDLDELLVVEVDEGQLQQIVMNLVINAAESLPDQSGRINLTVHHTTIKQISDDTNFIVPPPDVGKYAVITIHDNGMGISKEIQTQVFDPYFSTKGKGRGLGLSAVQGIIKRYNGGLYVATQEGVGTKIQVYLPLSTAQMADSIRETDVSVVDDDEGTKTILVVDDEAAVRETVQGMLETAGYHVLTASDGQAGVETYTAEHHRIDLVVMDVEMPHMNGLKALKLLRKIDPRVRAIISSGYTQQSFTDDIFCSQNVLFLQKPYKMETLLKTMKQFTVQNGNGCI